MGISRGFWAQSFCRIANSMVGQQRFSVDLAQFASKALRVLVFRPPTTKLNTWEGKSQSRHLRR